MQLLDIYKPASYVRLAGKPLLLRPRIQGQPIRLLKTHGRSELFPQRQQLLRSGLHGLLIITILHADRGLKNVAPALFKGYHFLDRW